MKKQEVMKSLCKVAQQKPNQREGLYTFDYKLEGEKRTFSCFVGLQDTLEERLSETLDNISNLHKNKKMSDFTFRTFQKMGGN